MKHRAYDWCGRWAGNWRLCKWKWLNLEMVIWTSMKKPSMTTLSSTVRTHLNLKKTSMLFIVSTMRLCTSMFSSVVIRHLDPLTTTQTLWCSTIAIKRIVKRYTLITTIWSGNEMAEGDWRPAKRTTRSRQGQHTRRQLHCWWVKQHFTGRSESQEWFQAQFW